MTVTTPAKSAEGFYVTAQDGGKTAWLLGPYATHDDALTDVHVGRRLAHEVSSWAGFWAFGTARIVMPPSRPLPRGKLNHLAAAQARKTARLVHVMESSLARGEVTGVDEEIRRMRGTDV